MMRKTTINYSLDFGRFSLEIVVDITSSIEQTLAFNTAPSDFVFAIGVFKLRFAQREHLLVSELQAGNLVQTLAELANAFSNAKHPDNVEQLIEKGGWCEWMRQYWMRVNSDGILPLDELQYSQLIPLAVLTGRQGHIAFYKYDNDNVLEVATRTGEDIEPVSVWVLVDSRAAESIVRQTRDQIVDDVHRALRVQNPE